MSSWLTSGSRRLKSKQRVGAAQYIRRGQDSRQPFQYAPSPPSSDAVLVGGGNYSSGNSLRYSSPMGDYETPMAVANNRNYGRGSASRSGAVSSDVANLSRFKLGRGGGRGKATATREITQEEVERELSNHRYEQQQHGYRDVIPEEVERENSNQRYGQQHQQWGEIRHQYQEPKQFQYQLVQHQEQPLLQSNHQQQRAPDFASHLEQDCFLSNDANRSLTKSVKRNPYAKVGGGSGGRSGSNKRNPYAKVGGGSGGRSGHDSGSGSGSGYDSGSVTVGISRFSKVASPYKKSRSPEPPPLCPVKSPTSLPMPPTSHQHVNPPEQQFMLFNEGVQLDAPIPQQVEEVLPQSNSHVRQPLIQAAPLPLVRPPASTNSSEFSTPTLFRGGEEPPIPNFLSEKEVIDYVRSNLARTPEITSKLFDSVKDLLSFLYCLVDGDGTSESIKSVVEHIRLLEAVKSRKWGASKSIEDDSCIRERLSAVVSKGSGNIPSAKKKQNHTQLLKRAERAYLNQNHVKQCVDNGGDPFALREFANMVFSRYDNDNFQPSNAALALFDGNKGQARKHSVAMYILGNDGNTGGEMFSVFKEHGVLKNSYVVCHSVGGMMLVGLALVAGCLSYVQAQQLLGGTEGTLTSRIEANLPVNPRFLTFLEGFVMVLNGKVPEGGKSLQMKFDLSNQGLGMKWQNGHKTISDALYRTLTRQSLLGLITKFKKDIKDKPRIQICIAFHGRYIGNWHCDAAQREDRTVRLQVSLDRKRLKSMR